MSVQDVLDILVSTGAMEADTLRILPLGLLARDIRGQNELWMAIALTSPVVAELTGPQLAAFIGALLCSEVIKRPAAIWTQYQVCAVCAVCAGGAGGAVCAVCAVWCGRPRQPRMLQARLLQAWS